MIDLEWKFNRTPFVIDKAPKLPHELIKKGPWSGHRSFAYDLVSFVKPNTIVELGTHYGTSFLVLPGGQGYPIIYLLLCCRYLER